MKTTLTKLPKSEIKLEVEVSQEEWGKARTEILKKFASKAEFPGYRRGKAPLALVGQKIGEGEIWLQTSEHLLVSTYPEAVLQEKLSVVCPPKIEIASRDPFRYTAHVAVFPDITVKGLEDIRIPEKTVTVEDSEVKEFIEDLLKQEALYETVDRGAEKGDRVEISFEGFDEQGVKLENMASKRHPVILGEGLFLEDFEKNIFGMKKGEQKDFSVVFPKDYRHKPLQGKKVRFDLEVLSVEKTLLPELTEDFIKKKIGAKMSLTDFDEHIRKNLLNYKKKAERQRREDELFDTLFTACTFEISPLVLDAEIDKLEEELKMDFKERGLDFEAYRKALDGKNKDIRADLKQKAEKRVRIRFIVGHGIEKLKIEVPEEEVQKAWEQEKDTPIETVHNRLVFLKFLDYFLKPVP